MLTAYDIRARLGLPLTPFANTAPSWCKDLADDAAALLAHIDAQNAGLLHAVDRHVEREVSREPSCNR